MIVCTYVVTYNTGLAPNPFHDVCTLALCTPNHKRSRLKKDDWIIGLAGAEIKKQCAEQDKIDRHRIVYAMKIDDVLTLGDYYNQYPQKRAKRNGTPIERMGDAIYKKVDDNLIHTKDSDEHDWAEVHKQDIYGNRVFIGHEFWHFGNQCQKLPEKVAWADKLQMPFAGGSIGIKYIMGGSNPSYQWTQQNLNEFKSWLSGENGLIGHPIHMDENCKKDSTNHSCGS